MTFDPTDEQRRTVKAMSGFGVPQPDIAIHVGVDPKTLRKHFREELDRGSIEATAKVAQSLFNMATQGNNVAAAIFWMKARAGWREKNHVELSGPDGSPLLHQILDDNRVPLEELARQALVRVQPQSHALGTST